MEYGRQKKKGGWESSSFTGLYSVSSNILLDILIYQTVLLNTIPWHLYTRLRDTDRYLHLVQSLVPLLLLEHITIGTQFIHFKSCKIKPVSPELGTSRQTNCQGTSLKLV